MVFTREATDYEKIVEYNIYIYIYLTPKELLKVNIKKRKNPMKTGPKVWKKL